MEAVLIIYGVLVPSDVDPTCSSIVSKTCPRVRLGLVRRARQKATMKEQSSSMLLFKVFSWLPWLDHSAKSQ